MTVYTFALTYGYAIGDTEYRYVAANTEEEAISKINAYINNAGIEKPVFVCNPYVELENVII